MRHALVGAGACAVLLAPTAGAQRGLSAPPPSSRAVSELTSSDSAYLAAAAARASIGTPTESVCVYEATSDLPSRVSAAFTDAAERHARRLPPADSGAHNRWMRLVRMLDGDTVTVHVTEWGSGDGRMWSNEMHHYFVRDRATQWRALGWQLRGASDYILTGSATRVPRCLNGRKALR